MTLLLTEPATPPKPDAINARGRWHAVRRIATFGFVGVAGFGIDAVLTVALGGVGLGPFIARAIAIPVAMLSTYGLNRTLTFHDSNGSGGALVAESLRYLAVAIAAAGFNWSVYAAALIASPNLPPVAALTLASLAAMGFSYIGYSRFAFRRD